MFLLQEIAILPDPLTGVRSGKWLDAFLSSQTYTWTDPSSKDSFTGDFIAKFEKLAQMNDPFEYPIQYITPRTY
jgi:hypothetical protein